MTTKTILAATAAFLCLLVGCGYQKTIVPYQRTVEATPAPVTQQMFAHSTSQAVSAAVAADESRPALEGKTVCVETTGIMPMSDRDFMDYVKTSVEMGLAKNGAIIAEKCQKPPKQQPQQPPKQPQQTKSIPLNDAGDEYLTADTSASAEIHDAHPVAHDSHPVTHDAHPVIHDDVDYRAVVSVPVAGVDVVLKRNWNGRRFAGQFLFMFCGSLLAGLSPLADEAMFVMLPIGLSSFAAGTLWAIFKPPYDYPKVLTADVIVTLALLPKRGGKYFERTGIGRSSITILNERKSPFLLEDQKTKYGSAVRIVVAD